MRTQESIFLLRDLQQVVLVAAGVLSILDLFLPPLQNRSIGLRIGWVQEAGVATTERGPAGLQEVRVHLHKFTVSAFIHQPVVGSFPFHITAQKKTRTCSD